MHSICDLYSMGIKKELRNYWAAWLPSTFFKLGDIGVLNGYTFEKRSSLQALGVAHSLEASSGSAPLELVSGSGVSVALKAKGELNQAFQGLPRSKAGIKINFGAEGAFVVQCPQTHESSIPDLLALQSNVLGTFESGRWNPEWAVVTRLISAPFGTILISNSADAQLELSLDSDLNAGLADLGRSQAGVDVRSYHGDMIKIIGGQNLTPFFQLARLKKRLFSDSSLVTLSMRRNAESQYVTTVPHPQDDPNLLQLEILEDEEFTRDNE